MIMHYRAPWPDPIVPEGEPTQLNYEVDVGADVVLRTVDVFANGDIHRNSIAIEERDGATCPSLVDGSFKDLADGVTLQEISPAEFERLWERGTDKPYWFVS